MQQERRPHRCGTGDGHASGDAVSGVGAARTAEEQVRRLTERRLLTPQQAEAVDMERIRAFLAIAAGAGASGRPGSALAGVSLCPADAGGAVRPGGRRERRLMLQGVVDCCLPHGGGPCGGGLQDRPLWLPARSRSGRRSTGPSWRPTAQALEPGAGARRSAASVSVLSSPRAPE